jgi:dGTP triphosphohydrolase
MIMYLRIETNELVEKVTNVLNSKGMQCSLRINGKGRRTKSTKHTLFFTIENTPATMLGTTIKPQIIVTNSFNGESSLEVAFGFYRLVCSNGMAVSMPRGQDDNILQRIRHIKGKTAEQKLKQLEYQIAALADSFEQRIRSLESLVNIGVRDFEIAAILAGLDLTKKVKEAVHKLWMNPAERRPEDRTNTVWSLWNIINEQTRLLQRSEAKTQERDSRLLGELLELRKAA